MNELGNAKKFNFIIASFILYELVPGIESDGKSG